MENNQPRYSWTVRFVAAAITPTLYIATAALAVYLVVAFVKWAWFHS